MLHIIRRVKYINIRTLFFNFYYFPPRIAFKLPVFISRNVKFTSMRGRVCLSVPPSMGMIKLGYHRVGIFDFNKEKFIWQVQGTIKFGENIIIGQGCRISVNEGAELIIGDGVKITANSNVIASHGISIGRDSLISWGCTLMDTDFHSIVDSQGRWMNPNRSIRIGSRNWICSNVNIYKGVHSNEGVIFAARSNVMAGKYNSHTLYGGNPAKLLKQNIGWEH